MEGFGLVAVEWMDSAQAQSGWRWLSEANLNVHLCRSVGWLIGEDDELLRLAQTVSAIGDDYQVCGVMAIPIAPSLAAKLLLLLRPVRSLTKRGTGNRFGGFAGSLVSQDFGGDFADSSASFFRSWPLLISVSIQWDGMIPKP